MVQRPSRSTLVGYLKRIPFSDAQSRATWCSRCLGRKSAAAAGANHGAQSNLWCSTTRPIDLDIEDPLDLLPRILSDSRKTVLLVSTDRDFLDAWRQPRLRWEGDGLAQAYPGGWSDYRRQPRRDGGRYPPAKPSKAKGQTAPVKAKATKIRPQLYRNHRLETLATKLPSGKPRSRSLVAISRTRSCFTQVPTNSPRPQNALGPTQSRP